MLAEAGVAAETELQAVNGKETATWTSVRMSVLDEVLSGEALVLHLRAPEGAQRELRLDTSTVPVDPEPLFAKLGLELYRPSLPVRLAEIVPGEPAAEAGLQPGDTIIARDGTPVSDWRGFVEWLRANPDTETRLTIERDGRQIERALTVGSAIAEGEQVGRLGARVDVPEDLWQDLRTVHREGIFEAAVTGVSETFSVAWLTLRMMGRMLIGDVSVDNISGPLQIAEYAGYTAAAGIVTYIGFLALISVSLGVLNLLPVPMLDGGHLLYYLVEAVKGSPVSERVQLMGQQIGLLMLAALMTLAFYNDLSRLFG